MRSQRHAEENLDFVFRLQHDRRFALDFLDLTLRTGEGSDIAEAFTQFALAFDGVTLPPEAIDPDEARIVLERLARILKIETREILLS